MTWSATGGTITAGGLYTAGSLGGTYAVIARVQDGTLADTSQVKVMAPTLTGLVVSPGTASLQTGAQKQFTVAGTWSDGSTTLPAVVWSATGGAITSGGLFTAGTVAGAYRVVALHQASGKADTAELTLSAPVILNGFERGPLELPPLPAWGAACRDFRDALARQPDLTTRLLRHVTPPG